MDPLFRQSQDRRRVLEGELRALQNQVDEAKAVAASLVSLRLQVDETRAFLATLEEDRSIKLDAMRQIDHDFVTIARDKKSAQEAMEQNIARLREIMTQETAAYETQKLTAEQTLADIRQETEKAKSELTSLRAAIEGDIRRLTGERDTLFAERDKAAERVESIMEECNIACMEREAAIAKREASAEKREKWNEQVRVKLGRYKEELENFYHREFKDIII